MLNFPLHFSSIEDIWNTCNRFSNPQCKLLVNSTIINILNSIWYARNQQRFENKKIHWKSSISSIISSVTIAGNNSKAISLSMSDFSLLKKFDITLHPPRAPKIIEVICHPPMDPWIKCNTDGCSTESAASSRGIFRNANFEMLLCFAEKLDSENAFQAEIMGTMRAIEVAFLNNWRHLWLEMDYAMVVHALKSNTSIPCKLRNRWFNCKQLLGTMNFIVSHIYREGNQCADDLANIGLNFDQFTMWDSPPPTIHYAFGKNKLGWPNF